MLGGGHHAESKATDDHHTVDDHTSSSSTHNAHNDHVAAAAVILAICVIGAPIYLGLWRLVRKIANSSNHLKHSMDHIEIGVASFLVGFSINLIILSVFLAYVISPTWHVSSSRFLIFFIELQLFLRVEALSWGCCSSPNFIFAKDFLMDALTIALAYAWLAQYQFLFQAMVYYSFRKTPNEDDELWLEETAGHLNTAQVFLVFTWFIAVFLSALLAHTIALYFERRAHTTAEGSCQRLRNCCCGTLRAPELAVSGVNEESDPADYRSVQRKRRRKATKKIVTLGVGFAAEKALLEVRSKFSYT